MLPKCVWNPWRKSDSISLYFRGGNPTTLPLKCVIAHKMLFSPRFRCENMAMGMPYFHDENPVEFCVLCTMAYQQGFMPMYMACANMLVLRRAGAPQSIKHVDTCRIHRETDVTWWHGSRRSNCNDYALIANALSTYSCHKVQSTHGQRGSLIYPQKSIIQSAWSPTHT